MTHRYSKHKTTQSLHTDKISEVIETVPLYMVSIHILFYYLECKTFELHGVGPKDNRPSTKNLYPFNKQKFI